MVATKFSYLLATTNGSFSLDRGAELLLIILFMCIVVLPSMWYLSLVWDISLNYSAKVGMCSTKTLMLDVSRLLLKNTNFSWRLTQDWRKDWRTNDAGKKCLDSAVMSQVVAVRSALLHGVQATAVSTSLLFWCHNVVDDVYLLNLGLLLHSFIF